MFTLTESHVRAILDPCASGNWQPFTDALEPEVNWWIADDVRNSLTAAGTYNLVSWTENVYKPLIARLDLTVGLNMEVHSLEVVSSFCWIFEFHPKTGKIVKIREYMNTALLRQVYEAADNV